MRITTDHSASSYGIPVILADDGALMDYGPGIQALRRWLGWSTQQLGDACGVSRRTVEGWEQGRMPTAAALNVMAGLAKRGGAAGRGTVKARTRAQAQAAARARWAKVKQPGAHNAHDKSRQGVRA